MTDEELAKLDEARAREAEAQYYEQLDCHGFANKIRAGQLGLHPMTAIAARLARTGWMPPVDPRLEAAREMIARICEVQGHFDVAGLWCNPDEDTTNFKAVVADLASCLPEGYSIADLPPVPEEKQ